MRVDVAILGATGMVGQRLVQLLHDHPTLRAAELCASDRSAGKPYGEAAPWRLEGEPRMQDHLVLPCDPARVRSRVVLSALDRAVALDIEPAFRDRGYRVISNASAFRMAEGVPLVIPEVNPDHVELVRGADGYIVTNPNCTCIPAVVALAPLHAAFGVEAVTVASYQAVSGAGYPGEPSWDILGTVHPHAGDEEQKVSEETRKLLGRRVGGAVALAPFPVAARCVRVPVVDGHLVAVHAKLRGDPPVAEVVEAMRAYRAPQRLPSSPEPLIHLATRRDRPNPRLDVMAGGGMAITVGRVEPCEVMTVKFFALAHNTIRGAAGAAIGNAELLLERGLLE